MSLMDIYNQSIQMRNNPQSAQPSGVQGGSYLWDQTAQNNMNQGNWFDANQQLGYNNLANITNFNSPLYQQYSQFLQKNTPSIGVNSLLAPLLAGGGSYAGSQNIANQKLQQMSRERQDSINTNVQGFAMGMQGQAMNQINSLQGNLQGQQQMTLANDQRRDANSVAGQIGGILGMGLGMWNPFGSNMAKGAR